MSQTRYVFSTSETVPYRFPTHTNNLVMDRAESEACEVFVGVVEPGGLPPLHVHHDTEQVFYILRGEGQIQVGGEEGGQAARHFPVKPGDVVRFPRHTWHRIQSAGQEPVGYLSVDCFVGGRPADKPTWDSHVRALCQANGWDYEKVRSG
jgi:mannose-6-phosphate isomerase-like protein (cupin superfamily)